MRGKPFETAVDPVELFNQALARAWEALCKNYELSANLPDLRALFEGIDLSNSDWAAELVLAQMLLEITESIGRFSRWYRSPARAFGLVSVRDNVSSCTRWILAPEAAQNWQIVLQPLSVAIQKNSGLIQAILLVDGLMSGDETEVCVTAYCACIPPHAIHIKKSLLIRANVVCDACQQQFA